LQGQAKGAGPAFSALSGGDHGAGGQHEPQPGEEPNNKRWKMLGMGLKDVF